MRVFVISLVSYISWDCQFLMTKNRPIVPIVSKTNLGFSTKLHERSLFALFLRLVRRPH